MKNRLRSVVVGLLGGSTTTFETKVMVAYNFKTSRALLASYEERYLLREYEEEYSQYKQKVSFILPVPRVTKIPEPVSIMMLALIIAFLLTLL